MQMRDKIIEDYKILLGIGWLQADDAGNVSLVVGDESRPVTVEGKRVVLPTREQMKNLDWSNRIGFHPLRESYNLGISDITANLRDQYIMRLNGSIGLALRDLIAIAHDQANQKNLTSEQSEVLNVLQNVSDSTVRDFESLLKKTKAKNDLDQFIGIFIKRGGEVKGQSYGRAGIVTFPIYEALKGTGEKVNGVKFSNKDREMLVRLFEFVLPSLKVEEGFNVGISSKTAPFLEALIRATFGVVSELVETMAPYMPLVSLPELLTFPDNMGFWLEVFDSKDMAERMQKCIPNLATGESDDEVEQPKAEARAATRQEIARKLDVPEERVTPREEPRQRGFLMGTPPPAGGASLGKSQPDQTRASSGTDRAPAASARAPRRDEELMREEDRRRREEADRERREEERRLREEREAKRELEEKWAREDRERDRERARQLGRDIRDDRDDRDYRGRDRYDRDERAPRGRTGDIFDDNPVLRSNLRDERDRDYRGRGRDRYDDRGRGGVRDLRSRGRDAYSDRDRDYDRDYDRRDRYYGRR